MMSYVCLQVLCPLSVLIFSHSRHSFYDSQIVLLESLLTHLEWSYFWHFVFSVLAAWETFPPDNSMTASLSLWGFCFRVVSLEDWPLAPCIKQHSPCAQPFSFTFLSIENENGHYQFSSTISCGQRDWWSIFESNC